MGHPFRPGARDRYPAEKGPPSDHRGGGHCPQTGDDADQQSEHDDEDLRHANLRTGENDTRTLTRVSRDDPSNQKRQKRMSDARIALAPMAASLSMITLTSRRGTSARTATHDGSASGAMVGDSSPGV